MRPAVDHVTDDGVRPLRLLEVLQGANPDAPSILPYDPRAFRVGRFLRGLPGGVAAASIVVFFARPFVGSVAGLLAVTAVSIRAFFAGPFVGSVAGLLVVTAVSIRAFFAGLLAGFANGRLTGFANGRLVGVLPVAFVAFVAGCLAVFFAVFFFAIVPSP